MEHEYIRLVLIFCAVFLAMALWTFFALHAMQHINDPIERGGWFLFFVCLFYIAPFLYFFTRWLSFRKKGKSWVIIKRQRSEESTLPNSQKE
jgi:hypothetical protein